MRPLDVTTSNMNIVDGKVPEMLSSDSSFCR